MEKILSEHTDDIKLTEYSNRKRTEIPECRWSYDRVVSGEIVVKIRAQNSREWNHLFKLDSISDMQHTIQNINRKSKKTYNISPNGYVFYKPATQEVNTELSVEICPVCGSHISVTEEMIIVGASPIRGIHISCTDEFIDILSGVWDHSNTILSEQF